MSLEQLPPNKPNFLLVVLIAGGVILVIFLIALAAVGWDGRRLLPHTFNRTNTSRLLLPESVAPGRLPV